MLLDKAIKIGNNDPNALSLISVFLLKRDHVKKSLVWSTGQNNLEKKEGCFGNILYTYQVRQAPNLFKDSKLIDMLVTEAKAR